MKNIIVYYFVAIIPVAIIFLLKLTNTIGSNWFVYSFGFYLFIYKTYINGKRLADKGVIERKDIWRMIVPGQRLSFLKTSTFAEKGTSLCPLIKTEIADLAQRKEQ